MLLFYFSMSKRDTLPSDKSQHLFRHFQCKELYQAIEESMERASVRAQDKQLDGEILLDKLFSPLSISFL